MILEEAATAEIMMGYSPEKGLYLPHENLSPMGAVGAMDEPDPLAYTEHEQSVMASWGTGNMPTAERVVTSYGSVEEIVSAETAEELKAATGMKKDPESGLILPIGQGEESVPGLLAKASHLLRNTRVGRTVTAFTLAASVVTGYSLANPETAQATSSSDQPPCVDSVESDCSYTPPPNNPPSSGDDEGQDNNPPKHEGNKHHPQSPKPEKAWPLGFINYNQGDWPYPDTGCGPDALAMVGATLEGNRHITPSTVTSQISPQFYLPGKTGTEPGAFFAMGHKWGLAVHETSLHHAQRILRAGGLAIVHAARGSGHFTMNGHYMVLKRVDSHGRFRIADPNGNGYSNDSEIRWWSPSTLKHKGIDDVWTFRKN